MTELAGAIGGAALAWLALFQLLLAGGAPLGHLAWGGAQRVLPTSLRIASFAVALLAVLGAIALAQAGGLLSPLLPPAWLPWLLWGFVGLFGLSFVGNMATSSRLERLHGAPLTVVIASCSLWLALSGG
ncbi:hypothetical protein [Aliiruegeria sabulilitoris]|uniref:hypothetical protein n=1 Tax=Aliiruegeria sabulilitoris TaxID=1510458 RepID=UPI000835474F|nr:hypothetical protein [Aliiruegeria sabulilitoris]NDR59334.1 hypothetical protein [Pseudoruegeria sp. M32A2M]